MWCDDAIMWSLQVYTCKNGEKKYLFAHDIATNDNNPDLRYIKCVKKGVNGRAGLLRNCLDCAWTLKWNPNTKSTQQVVNQNAEKRAATCTGDKVVYG